MNRRIEPVVKLIPWVYLVVYAFAVHGMARMHNATMKGELVPDPIYNNAQLTMTVSFWVTFCWIVVGYLLVRYACRIALKATMNDRVKALEDRVAMLESEKDREHQPERDNASE